MSPEEIMKQRQSIVKEALSWQGTPFHHAACVKGGGVDCAHLLKAIYKTCIGIPADFPEFPGFSRGQYPPQWHLHDLNNIDKADFYLHGFARSEEGFFEVNQNQIAPGDAVLAVIGRTFCHAGIIVNWPKVIQAESAPLGSGKVVLANATANWFLSRRELKFFSRKDWHEHN